jgi:RNA polymerase sigma-70 factor (ECF subfamily)
VRAQAGDLAALDQLLREMLPWLFFIARAALRNDADAWDVVQETVLRLYQGLATFNPRKGSARTWAGRIARNQIIDLIRAQTRRRQEPLDNHDLGSNRDDPATAAEVEESRIAVTQALNSLRAADRTAIVLRYDGGLSYDELGHALQVPVGTAATRIHRGIKLLRDRLRKTG